MNPKELQSLIVTMKQFRKEIRLRLNHLQESNAFLAEQVRVLVAALAQSQTGKGVPPASQTVRVQAGHTAQQVVYPRPLLAPDETSPSTFPEIRCNSTRSLRDHLEGAL